MLGVSDQRRGTSAVHHVNESSKCWRVRGEQIEYSLPQTSVEGVGGIYGDANVLIAPTVAFD